MKRIHIIGLIFLMVNCTIVKEKQGNSDSLNHIFSEKEIKDLLVLRDFFLQSICESDQDIQNCFIRYFEKAKLYSEKGEVYLPISFARQIEISESLKDSTFFQIWSFGESSTQENPTDNVKSIYFQLESKYMTYLKKASEKDKFIKDYQLSIIAHGGDPAHSLTEGIMMNLDKVNFKNADVQLVIAIHYLTLNDLYKRNERF